MKKNEENDVLDRYRQLRVERNLLKSMLVHLEELTEEDIIISMNFERMEELKGQRHIASGHTQYIAMNYKKEFRERYEKELKDCFERFIVVDKELTAIGASIKLLPEYLQQFINYYIVDGLTWSEIEDAMSVSHSGLGQWRKRANKLLNEYMKLIL